MRVSTGPIAIVRRDWELKPGAITSVVSNDGGGRPEVLCAQMLCGAAISGIKTLVLLPGMRTDDPVWQTVGQLIGGGDAKTAARELRLMKMVMYASGTGREHVGKAELVYAPGLRSGELERISGETMAPVLTMADPDDPVTLRKAAEVIRVGGDTISLDSEGFEFSVVFDPSGPVYSPA